MKKYLYFFIFLLLIPFIKAGDDTSYWQGQYYVNDQFQSNSAHDFVFTVYDDELLGNMCFNNSEEIITGNWGQWNTTQTGVHLACGNYTKNYYLEITIDGDIQSPRRRLIFNDYVRKNSNATLYNITATNYINLPFFLNSTSDTLNDGYSYISDKTVVVNMSAFDNRYLAGGYKSYYFTNHTSDVIGMYNTTVNIDDVHFDEAPEIVVTANDGETTIAEFISVPEPEFRVATGTRFFHINAKVSNIVKITQLRGEIYRVNLTGGNPILLRNSTLSAPLTTSKMEYTMTAPGSIVVINTSERILFKIIAIKEVGGALPDVTLYLEDDTLSRLDVPSPVGVTDISGLVPYSGSDTNTYLGVYNLTANNLFSNNICYSNGTGCYSIWTNDSTSTFINPIYPNVTKFYDAIISYASPISGGSNVLMRDENGNNEFSFYNYGDVAQIQGLNPTKPLEIYSLYKGVTLGKGSSGNQYVGIYNNDSSWNFYADLVNRRITYGSNVLYIDEIAKTVNVGTNSALGGTFNIYSTTGNPMVVKDTSAPYFSFYKTTSRDGWFGDGFGDGDFGISSDAGNINIYTAGTKTTVFQTDGKVSIKPAGSPAVTTKDLEVYGDNGLRLQNSSGYVFDLVPTNAQFNTNIPTGFYFNNNVTINSKLFVNNTNTSKLDVYGNSNITGNLVVTGNFSAKRPYWNGYDNSTQNFLNTSLTQVINISNNNDYDSYLIDVVGNQNLTFKQTGDYLCVLSPEFYNAGTNALIAFWIQKNGVDINWSNSRFSMRNGEYDAPAITFQFDIENPSTDNIRFMWYSDNTGSQIISIAAPSSPARPGIPGIILNCQKVSEIIP